MKRIAPFAATLLLSSCASIFSGTTQDITLRTTPGATYSITDTYGKQVASGNTQGTANLERGAGYFSPHAYKARISKPGYQPKTIDIQPGMNPWYFANILLGGVVGMIIVDPLTGAMYKFYPSDIEAPLEPINGEQPPANQPQHSSKTTPTSNYSTFEYQASQVAKEQGCPPKDSPSFDGVKDPHEILIFQCPDGRKLSVICSSTTGCR
jgi:hypothetical protein